MKKLEILRAQLAALDSQIEAQHGLILAMMEMLEDEPQGCAHKKAKDISTIGEEPIYECSDCGETFEKDPS